MSNKNFINAYYFSIIPIMYYSVMKEREEMGCNKFSVEKQCNELNSVFLKNTQPLKNDSKEILTGKLLKLLSIYQGSAVWRRCYIIATAMFFIIRIFAPDIKDEFAIAMHLLFVAVLYFYHNYLNYHLYRLAKNIGEDIVAKINKMK